MKQRIIAAALATFQPEVDRMRLAESMSKQLR